MSKQLKAYYSTSKLVFQVFMFSLILIAGVITTVVQKNYAFLIIVIIPIPFIFLVTKKLFNKNPQLIIDETGIYTPRHGHKNWKEIEYARVEHISNEDSSHYDLELRMHKGPKISINLGDLNVKQETVDKFIRKINPNV